MPNIKKYSILIEWSEKMNLWIGTIPELKDTDYGILLYDEDRDRLYQDMQILPPAPPADYEYLDKIPTPNYSNVNIPHLYIGRSKENKDHWECKDCKKTNRSLEELYQTDCNPRTEKDRCPHCGMLYICRPDCKGILGILGGGNFEEIDSSKVYVAGSTTTPSPHAAYQEDE